MVLTDSHCLLKILATSRSQVPPWLGSYLTPQQCISSVAPPSGAPLMHTPRPWLQQTPALKRILQATLVYALRLFLLRPCPVCPCSIQAEAFLYSCFSLCISSSRKHSDHPCISPFVSPLLSTPSSTKTLRTLYHANCFTYLTLSIIMQAFWREELFNTHLCIPGV